MNPIISVTEPDSGTGIVLVVTKCPWCKRHGEVKCNIIDLQRYMKGDDDIQNLMPYLDPDQREMIKTGICALCWDKYLREEPDES